MACDDPIYSMTTASRPNTGCPASVVVVSSSGTPCKRMAIPAPSIWHDFYLQSEGHVGLSPRSQWGPMSLRPSSPCTTWPSRPTRSAASAVRVESKRSRRLTHSPSVCSRHALYNNGWIICTPDVLGLFLHPHHFLSFCCSMDELTKWRLDCSTYFSRD